MSWEAEDVSLVLLEWLKPHEEIKIKNRDKLLEMTKKWGGFTKPLLVDSQTGAILDGHHRHSVAVCLGLKRVPVILIDYMLDDEITVDVWPGCGLERITKQDFNNYSGLELKLNLLWTNSLRLSTLRTRFQLNMMVSKVAKIQFLQMYFFQAT